MATKKTTTKKVAGSKPVKTTTDKRRALGFLKHAEEVIKQNADGIVFVAKFKHVHEGTRNGVEMDAIAHAKGVGSKVVLAKMLLEAFTLEPADFMLADIVTHSEPNK